MCSYTAMYGLFCQLLERVSSQYQASYQEAKAQYNVQKNGFPDKLPSEYLSKYVFTSRSELSCVLSPWTRWCVSVCMAFA